MKSKPSFQRPFDPVRRRLGLGAGAAVGMASLGLGLPAAAQSYPARPIRWIIPYAAGGGADVGARLYGKQMEAMLHQPFVIDNKPGGATVIGLNALLAAPADGYTIMMGNDSLAINPILMEKVPTLAEIVGISALVKGGLALVSRADYPARTPAEAIAYIKAQNGKLSFGSWGVGGTAHLAMETLLDRLGASMVHVPYNGAAPSIAALASGQGDIMFTDLATAASFIKSGRLKLWALANGERHPAYPDVPTIAEVGFPGFDWFAWFGVLAKKGTPPEVLARLSATIIAVGNEPAFKKDQIERGNIPYNSTPKEMDDLLQANATAAKAIIDKRGIKLST